MIDAKTWMAHRAATLILEHRAGPRCGTDDVLQEDDAMRLASDLMEDPAYRNLEPREAAEAFMKHAT